MNRIDRDVAQGQVFIVVAVGCHVPAAGFKPHLDVELAAFANRGDRQVAIQHFHVGVRLNLSAQNLSGTVDAEPRDADSFAAHLEWDLLQVQDDVGGVFDHARNGAEFVSDAFDADGGDGGAFNGAEQDAAQARADGGSKAALERLGSEHAVAFGESFRIGDQPFRLLKTFKHSSNIPFLDPGPRGSASYFEYNSAISNTTPRSTAH